jgi:hypothetical protein
MPHKPLDLNRRMKTANDSAGAVCLAGYVTGMRHHANPLNWLRLVVYHTIGGDRMDDIANDLLVRLKTSKLSIIVMALQAV